MEVNKILQGDCLERLKEMPDNSVDCLMTSPPYWALRDYGSSVQSIWDGKKDCEHNWITERTPRPHGSGGKTDWAKEKLSIKGVDNFSEYTDYNDRATYSDFCIKCGAWKGQLGLEPTFDLYIKHLCDIFDEVKRVITKQGTVYVNLGDCYAGNMGKKSGWTDNKLGYEKQEAIDKGVCLTKKIKIKHELPQKCLVGIPLRFAIEMMNRGWILRNTIIWHKRNCMPSSARDRFTIDFEYVFMFVKNKNYYFDKQYEPRVDSSKDRYKYQFYQNGKMQDARRHPNGQTNTPGYKKYNEGLRNKRCVWNITTKPYKEAHFATYPESLCETPIMASCPEEVCVSCGKPVQHKEVSVGYIDDPEIKEVIIKDNKPYSVQNRTGYVEVRNLPSLNDIKNYLNNSRKVKGLSIKEIENILNSQAPHHWFSGESYPSKEDWIRIKEILCFDDKYDKLMTDVKYKPAEKLKAKYEKVKISCNCNKGFRKGIVLDPFFGAGTTGLTALKNNRDFLGIELNEEYISIAEKRLKPFLNQTNLGYNND